MPICLVKDNPASAVPFAFSSRSVAKIFNGAPKIIPIPNPAMLDEIKNCHLASSQVGKSKNPIAVISPDKKTVIIGPLLSTNVQPRADPTPDARASGVIQ